MIGIPSVPGNPDRIPDSSCAPVLNPRDLQATSTPLRPSAWLKEASERLLKTSPSKTSRRPYAHFPAELACPPTSLGSRKGVPAKHVRSLISVGSVSPKRFLNESMTRQKKISIEKIGPFSTEYVSVWVFGTFQLALSQSAVWTFAMCDLTSKDSIKCAGWFWGSSRHIVMLSALHTLRVLA